MFSEGLIRWCLWLPLVLLVLVSNWAGRAQDQGKFSLSSNSSPSHVAVALSLHPLLPSNLAHHHSSLLSSLKPHLSDLLYLHTPPPLPPPPDLSTYSPAAIPPRLKCRLSPIRLYHAQDPNTSVSLCHFTLAARQRSQALPPTPPRFVGVLINALQRCASSCEDVLCNVPLSR